MNKIKVIEIEGITLKENAKYIFTLSPWYADDIGYVFNELDKLIGKDRFVLLPIEKGDLKVFEIVEPTHES